MTKQKEQSNFHVARKKEFVGFAKKIKNDGSWIMKSLLGNSSEAIEETVAQEFFRLICSFYPKTRWSKENYKGKDQYFVLSKEIPGFKPCFFSTPEGSEDTINGNLEGLASAQILALLLNEVDFHESNVGIVTIGTNQKKKIIKIDGGLCFAERKRDYADPELYDLLKDRDFNITERDIEALPLIYDYQAVNWLDLISMNKDRSGSISHSDTTILKNLSENARASFIKERNQIILRICLLPEKLIRYFTSHYVPDDKIAKELAEFIITRKKRLQAVAEQIKGFQYYKSSPQAQEDILTFVNELEQFKTMGKSVLLTDIKEKQGFDIKNSIFEVIIPRYSLIRKFYDELHELHLNDVNQAATILVNELKEVIDEYFKQPTLTAHQTLFSTLQDAKEKLKNLNLLDNDPLISSINEIITQLDEERHYESLNKELIKKMENKYNVYIYNCIFNYMDEKFKEIEFIAQKNNLDFKDVFYLKNIFLKRVEQIDFYEAYFKKEFKSEGALNLKINHESFLSYIHSEAIAPELSSMDKFAYDSMMSPALRNDYLNKIEDISKLSLAYQSSNKKYIIDGFNADIKLQSSYLKETLKPDMACVQKKLLNLLEKFQIAENQYYNTLFFAKNFRKRHSSLQVKINEAKNIVDKFLSEEKDFPKNVKHKI